MATTTIISTRVKASDRLPAEGKNAGILAGAVVGLINEADGIGTQVSPAGRAGEDCEVNLLAAEGVGSLIGAYPIAIWVIGNERVWCASGFCVDRGWFAQFTCS
jgi:hypothetical protein